jgi:hypothetical protein
VKRTGKWTCWPERVVLIAEGGVGMSGGDLVGVWDSVFAVVLIQYVSKLHPVGRHGDGFAAYKEF